LKDLKEKRLEYQTEESVDEFYKAITAKYVLMFDLYK
jgi:hypothetical protein